MENVAAPVAAPKQKSPILAAIGSFFIPGLGQVYNGEGFLKGLLYIIGVSVGSIILLIPGILIWIYGIYNAYSVAKKINAGLIPFKETTTVSLIIYVILALIIYIVIFVIIALFVAIILALIFGMSNIPTSY